MLIGSREPTTQALIANVLRGHSDPVAITTAANGEGVIEALGSNRPDLVFLDVQLGKPDAFDVIEAVGMALMPPVVFIAPNREFASRAFEVRALDYLVRPLTRRRVSEAVSRAREHVRRERALAAADRRLDPPSREDHHDDTGERITVRAGNRIIFVDPAEIDWIEAGHNYVRLHVGSKSYRVRRTMAELEAALSGRQFARVHRGILVRLGQIRELRLKPGWRLEAVLKTGVTLPVSRTHRTRLLRRLGGK